MVTILDKVKTQTFDEAIKAIQKVMKPLRLIDWEVGKNNDLKMAGIQKQKNIPQNLYTAFRNFMDHCFEYQKQKSAKEEIYDLIVQDNAGLTVCNEKIKISKREFDKLDKAIEDGKFLLK